MNFTIFSYDSIDSTNTEALKQARQGADEGLCIIARQQTAGRGRRGRTWVSEKDAGLYFSIVLRPRIEANYLTLITLMAGVAVHDTLKELGLKPDIKWVNDILIGEKKIAGILAETAETENGTAVVLGIGVNIKSASVPPEIAETATSIEAEGCRTSQSEVLERLLNNISRNYDVLQSENVAGNVIGAWRARSTYYSGKRVKVTAGNKILTGITDGLEPNGALRIINEDGKLSIVQAGVVQQLRAGAG